MPSIILVLRKKKKKATASPAKELLVQGQRVTVYGFLRVMRCELNLEGVSIKRGKKERGVQGEAVLLVKVRRKS